MDLVQQTNKIITFQEFMKNQAKKLEEFTDKDVIHCPTGELANKICELLNDNDFEWASGNSYLKSNNWKTFKQDTCYLVSRGEYCSINYYKNKGYTIYKAEDILALYEKDMNKTQNITGYKAPYDLAEGMVKKGTIYKKVQEDDRFYAPEGKISKTTLPKEIVETWEKVYEEEFKVGDWVIMIKDYTNNLKKGDMFKVEDSKAYPLNDPKSTCVSACKFTKTPSFPFKDFLRKATQEEIDSLFTKTLTLSNGKEVIIKDGKIMAHHSIIDYEYLIYLLRGNISKIRYWEVELTDATYKIGCWENVKLSDIKMIIEEANKQKELMKD